MAFKTVLLVVGVDHPDAEVERAAGIRCAQPWAPIADRDSS